jgi:hypothetical protein
MTTLRTGAAVAAIACLSTLSLSAHADDSDSDSGHGDESSHAEHSHESSHESTQESAHESTHGGDPATDLSNSPIILSLERGLTFFTYAQTSTSQTQMGITASATGTSTTIGLVGGYPYSNGAGALFPMVPRIGVDTVVGAHVTLGGGIWVLTDVSASASTNTSIMGMSMMMSQDAPKGTYWGIAPRIGYLLPASSSVALWPRAGIEYHSVSTSTVTNNGVMSGGNSLNQFSADLEANLVITPFPHFGINLALFGAIPLSGSDTTNTGTTTNPGGTTTTNQTTVNVSETVVGLTVGLLGYY